MNKTQIPLYELEDVSVEKGGHTLLRIARFQFHRGTIYGIVGPNGAGKTTFLNLLSGRSEPTKGRLLYEQKEFEKTWLGKIKQPKDVRSVMDSDIEFKGTVMDYVKDNQIDKPDRLKSQYFTTGKGSKIWDRQIGDLSNGEKSYIKLIVRLESDPKVILVDDFASQFDSNIRKTIYRTLHYFNRSRGTSIILAANDIFPINPVASVVINLDHGHIAKVRSSQQ